MRSNFDIAVGVPVNVKVVRHRNLDPPVQNENAELCHDSLIPDDFS
jgi:hypothetical protein